jgi:hypothetical protein
MPDILHRVGIKSSNEFDSITQRTGLNRIPMQRTFRL